MADKQDGTSDVFTGWAILAVILGAFGWMVWWLWGDHIGNGIRWFRVGEMWIISHFLPDDYTVQWRNFTINFKEWLERAQTIPAGEVDLRAISLLSTLALTPLAEMSMDILAGLNI